MVMMAPPKKKSITIVGAGSVGVNTALILDKLGYDVTLIEKGPDILQGSAQNSYIEHADGFEYFLKDHRKTGESCVDGSIVKALTYPSDFFRTNICGTKNPIRFLVSFEALKRLIDSIFKKPFFDNVDHMHRYFNLRFAQIANLFGLDDLQTSTLLGRKKETFSEPLTPQQYSDLTNIAFGVAGAGTGINMPYYYAYLKQALHESNVKIKFDTEVTSLTKKAENEYETILSDGTTLTSNHTILAAGQNNFQMRERIHEAGTLKPPIKGTYYLNGMMYVTLPPTHDPKKIEALKHINFTLQANEGCAFTGLVLPTATQPGQAVVYFPSETGNQIRKHTVDSDESQGPPKEWEEILSKGFKETHPEQHAERKAKVIKQAEHYYPFLKNYAQFDDFHYACVFNADSPASDFGKKRNAREIAKESMVTEDGSIQTYNSPKWTNAELVAYTAANRAVQKLADIRLEDAVGVPVFEKKTSLEDDDDIFKISDGFGPDNINIIAMSKMHETLKGVTTRKETTGLNFFLNSPPKVEDALRYAEMSGINSRFVDPNAAVFRDVFVEKRDEARASDRRSHKRDNPGLSR